MTLSRLAAAAALVAMLGHAHANLVANGSFEAAGPDFSANGSYCYLTSGPYDCGSLPGWTGSLPVMTSNSGPWGNPSGLANWSAAFGAVQVGLQNESHVEQLLSLAAGTYDLSWSDAGRGNWGNAAKYEVRIGGNTIAAFDTAIGQAWSEHTLRFTVSGPQELRFAGIAVGADGTAFLDNVRVSAVPEPGSMALMFAGLAAVGVTARRRRA